MERSLTLMHVPTESMGYGRLGVMLADSLRVRGVDLYTDIGEPPVSGSHVSAPVGRRPETPTSAVCWVAGPSHANGWWKGQRPFIFTMWEATRLPEAYRENLHEFEKVIVPSMHNAELFGRYHPQVEYCPLGVDPARWKPTPRRDPAATFRFLIGGSGARKGTDLAFKAFRAVFGDGFDAEGRWSREGPAPVLVMKNPRGEDFHAPWVEMISGKISAEAEVALYETAHVYVQPSRGEGFGLQPLQALAQGCPTILTDAHGHASFAKLGVPIGWSYSKAEYFIYGDAGDWFEPDFDELCEAMHDTYTNYDPHRERAATNAQTVVTEFSWDNCAARLEEILGDAITTPYAGPFTGYHDRTHWETPESKLYLVITDRDHWSDLPDGRHYWKRGEEYYETSDIKRILFEKDLLDPACLTDYQIGDECGRMDAGLSASQIAEIPNYSSRHSYCPTCNQQLNTQPTLEDAIEAELLADA